MTMINLTAGNNSLAKIRAIRSPKAWANLTVAMLAKADKENLLAVAEVVFNEKLTESNDAVAIQFDEDKNYKRSYAPSLYKSPDSDTLCVKFGTSLFTFKDDILDVAAPSIELVKLEKYEDPCMVLSVEIEEDEYISLPLPLRLTKEFYQEIKGEDGLNLVKLKGWLKKGNLAKLASALMVAKTGGGAKSNDLVKLTDFAENSEVKLTSFRSVKTSYGRSFIINALNTDGTEVSLWAPYALKEYLELGAEFGDATNLIYVNYTNRKGEIKQSVSVDGLVWPQDEDSADIDMSIFS